MSVLSISQALGYASRAGFTGNGLATIVAIAMCESSLNTHGPDNINSGGSRDRGLYQINNYYHPEVSDACAYDPTCASQAAYRISSNGTNFSQWSTYPACSNTKIQQVRAAMTSNGSGQAPWYTYPRIDNYGGVEPFGGFKKPDSNIQIPANYPVTALLSGTVTAIDGGNVGWGAAVTIKLDAPINAIATHTAYLHLANAVVRVGQHVSSGTLIGYNGSANAAGSQKVPLGFALYNGDHYGFGPTWSQYLGSPQLNPVPVLNAATSGTLAGVNSAYSTLAYIPNAGGGPITAITSTVTTVMAQAHQIVNTVPGFTGICEGLDTVETFQAFVLPTKAATDLATATQNNDIRLWGWDTTIPNPFGVVNSAVAATQLPSDTMQAIFVFALTNFAAFVVRSIFVSFGIILFIALALNFASSVIDTSDIASTVAKTML